MCCSVFRLMSFPLCSTSATHDVTHTSPKLLHVFEKQSGTTMTFLRVTPAWRQKKIEKKLRLVAHWEEMKEMLTSSRKKKKKAFEAEDDCLKMPRKHVEFENSRRLVSFDERASPRAHSVRTTDVTRSSAFERHSSRTRQRRRLWFHSFAQSTAFLLQANKKLTKENYNFWDLITWVGDHRMCLKSARWVPQVDWVQVTLYARQQFYKFQLV